MYPKTPIATLLKDYRPPEFLIDAVDLRFDLDPETTIVSSELSLRRNPVAPRGAGDLRLHGEALTLDDIALDDIRLPPSRYRVEAGELVVRRVPDRFRLRARVRIQPRANTLLEGLYLSGDLLCTQCEAEGFRRITYFLDRPDVMARYRVTLVADPRRYPVLLANGNPVGGERLPDGRHLARWEDPFPKPCYLFALVAGDLALAEDRFTTRSGRAVSLRLYVEPREIDKCAHAMESLKRAMRWDEERYGREYDLDLFMIVAVSHFNMGAMENKGLNLFNARYILARPETATDTDFAGIAGVVAHEYFHNWTGNRITCRDWFQLSLKEGFTVYRDQEFSADMGSRAVQRINDARQLRARQFAEDSGPLAHPVRPESYIEINNFYTATVYEKGAELVRMLALLLGAERFREATDLYFERHDGQAVTIEDFLRCMEDASGRDLTQFRLWYSQAGTPRLECAARWDPAAGHYRLDARQHTPPTPGQPVKAPLHLPLALGLLDGEGRELPVQLLGEASPPAPGTRLLELRAPFESMTFVGLTQRPVPSLARGFSAPARLEYPYTDADLMLLMARDSDGFNRWDAAQTLVQRRLLALLEQPDAPLPDDLIDAFGQALRDTGVDPALRAEILTPPSESWLGEQLAAIDVDGIHRARERFIARLAMALRDDLRAVHQRYHALDDASMTAAAMGQRALKNRALAYLMRVPDAEILELCQTRFDTARTMTDAIAALRLLVGLAERGPSAPGEAALAAFHRRWANDALVIDKWFAIQARSPAADTLARVARLLDHPDFTLGNPNRVRALLGAFATGNPLRFHAADGGGYRLLTEQLVRLDPLNPRIAARLVQPLTRWRRFDAARQALMREQLLALRASAGLSRDLFEVVSKALEDETPA